MCGIRDATIPRKIYEIQVQVYIMYRSRYRPSRRHILRPQDSGRGVVETTYPRRNKRDVVFQASIGTLLKTINGLPPIWGKWLYMIILSFTCESHVTQRGDRSPMTSHPRTSNLSVIFPQISVSPPPPHPSSPSHFTLLSEQSSPCNRTIRPPSTSSSDSRYRSISPPSLSSP